MASSVWCVAAINLMHTFLLLHLLVQVVSSQTIITKAPENIVAEKGNDAVLQCEQVPQGGAAVVEYKWEECITQSYPTCNLIVTKDVPINSSKHEAIGDPQPDVYNLKVKNTELSDGGLYLCYGYNSDLSATEVRTADLVITDGKPNCGHNSTTHSYEGDFIRLHCQITYRGNLQPEWSWEPPTAIHEDDPENGISTVTFQLTADNHEDIYTCITSFNAPVSPEDVQATNPPEYDESCATEKLNVLYISRNVAILHIRDGTETEITNEVDCNYEIYQNDILRCTADANPPPSDYMWSVNKSDPIIKQEIKVESDWSLGATEIQCNVTNEVGVSEPTDICVLVTAIPPTTTPVATTSGQRTTQSVDRNTSKPTPDQSEGTHTISQENSTAYPITKNGGTEGWIIAVAVVAACIAVLLIVLVIFLYVRKRNSKEKEKQTNTTAYNRGTDVVRQPGQPDVIANQAAEERAYGNVYNRTEDPKKKKVPTATLR